MAPSERTGVLSPKCLVLSPLVPDPLRTHRVSGSTIRSTKDLALVLAVRGLVVRVVLHHRDHVPLGLGEVDRLGEVCGGVAGEGGPALGVPRTRVIGRERVIGVPERVELPANVVRAELQAYGRAKEV